MSNLLCRFSGVLDRGVGLACEPHSADSIEYFSANFNDGMRAIEAFSQFQVTKA